MTSRNRITIFAIAVLTLMGVITSYLLTRPNPPQKFVPPKPKPTRTVFSSLSASNTYLGATGWAAGMNTHAEWFVPDASGELIFIEIAIEPSYVRKGREKIAGGLNLFLAQDEGGFPGAVLERFSIAAGAPSSPPPSLPLVFESAAQPKLQAGVKYWLCAGCSGPGSWVWRFNDQDLMLVSARQHDDGQWKSAGNGRNGAFRVIVTVDDTPVR
jgi:hypothetical protein